MEDNKIKKKKKFVFAHGAKYFSGHKSLTRDVSFYSSTLYLYIIILHFSFVFISIIIINRIKLKYL